MIKIRVREDIRDEEIPFAVGEDTIKWNMGEGEEPEWRYLSDEDVQNVKHIADDDELGIIIVELPDGTRGWIYNIDTDTEEI